MPTRFSRLAGSPAATVIGLGALALAAGPRLAGATVANWAAVGLMTACGSAVAPAHPPASADVPGIAPAQRDWLLAAQGRCRGDAAATESALQAMLAESPDHLDVARTIAPQDRALAETAVAHYPDNAAAQLWLAAARAAAGDSAGAIAAYERGLAVAPANADAWMALGALYDAQPDLHKAAAAYDQACFYVDRGKNGCTHAAQLHMQLGEYAAAVARWTDARHQSGGDFLAGVRKQAENLLAAGQIDGALPLLRTLAQAGDAAARSKLAELGYSP